MELEQRLREVVRASFEAEVVCFVGYEKGSDSLRTRPCFVRESGNVDRLVWDPFCSVNLAKYALTSTPPAGKIGLAAKGCDARSLVELLKHNQIRRERLFVVGMPCGGQVDLDKLKRAVGAVTPEKVEADGEEFVLVTEDGERRVKSEELVMERCLTCRHPDSFQYDVALGEMSPPSFAADDSFEDVKGLEKLPVHRRAEYWDAHFSLCLRCHACRNVCPGCFCSHCIFEQTAPGWVSKASGGSENRLYHLIRAFHVAGRCTDCGECEKACPVGIPLRELHRKLERDLQDLVGYEGAGIRSDTPPPLTTFDADDPEPSE